MWDDGGGYHRRTRLAALGTVQPPRTDRRDVRGTTLYAVTVEVSWPGDGEARRHVVLETRRLGPAEAVAP